MTVPVRYGPDGNGTASFGRSCTNCPLRAGCTTAAGGRTIGVGAHEDALARARDRQKGPEWAADYRATRPKVERKLGHLMRRRHGGRRARVRGRTKVDADFNLLAAATNLARLAVLGLRSTPRGWAAEREQEPGTARLALGRNTTACCPKFAPALPLHDQHKSPLGPDMTVSSSNPYV